MARRNENLDKLLAATKHVCRTYRITSAALKHYFEQFPDHLGSVLLGATDISFNDLEKVINKLEAAPKDAPEKKRRGRPKKESANCESNTEPAFA